MVFNLVLVLALVPPIVDVRIQYLPTDQLLKTESMLHYRLAGSRTDVPIGWRKGQMARLARIRAELIRREEQGVVIEASRGSGR